MEAKDAHVLGPVHPAPARLRMVAPLRAAASDIPWPSSAPSQRPWLAMEELCADKLLHASHAEVWHLRLLLARNVSREIHF